MTAGSGAAGAITARQVTRSKLKLALAIAQRELGSGAGELTVFVLCIALGVAAVAAIGSLAASFDQALARQGRTLIGGDLSFELIHRQVNQQERAALEALGQVSDSASFRAMARSPDGKSALIEVKAVDGAYPLYGDVSITRAGKAGPIWRDGDVVLVEQTLLDRLNLDVGSKLLIGEATATIGGVLGEQPDRLADRLAYGPKLLMSHDTLGKTGLVQPGSLIRWTYRVKLPEPNASDKDALAATRKDIETRFPESGFAIHDWTDPAPSLRRDADRFTQFINFVGLTALLLGGIGVGNAIRSYMAKKREIIAIFKCLGASSGLVLGVYMLQALFLASLGIALGLVVGAAAPAAIATVYGNTIPIDLAIEPHPLPLLTAALAGLLTMALFVLWPLGRAALVSPAVLMRAHLSEERERSSLPFALGSVAAGGALFALAIAASEERLITASISAGIVVSFGLLSGFGILVQRAAARWRRTSHASLALALASIGGPGSLARSIAVSLGLGLGLLVATALIHRSLVKEIDGNIEVDAPAYYFLDVEETDLNVFRDTVKAIQPDAKLADAPMLRGRIVKVKDVPVDQLVVEPDARWVLAGDRGLTYTDEVPLSSTITAGEWWPKGYSGEPLVSFDEEIAKGTRTQARRSCHRQHSRPKRRRQGREPAQDRLGVARHQLRDGVLAEHAARRTAPRADDARISQGHRPRARGQGGAGAGRGLPAGDRHQGRRHRRGGQGAARQGDERDQGDGRRDPADRRGGARGRGRRRAAAAQISRCAVQDARRNPLSHHQCRAARIRPARPRHGAACGRHRYDHRLGLVQVGLRGHLRVHADCRGRDGSARAWARARRRRHRHLAGAVG